MTEEEQDSIEMMLMPLIEFSYGFDQLQAAMLGGAGDASAVVRFYVNALYMYSANFFLIRGDNKLSGAMKRLNLDHMLDPLSRILQTHMGVTTLGEILDIYRDKLLTHNPFRSRVYDEIYALYDLEDPENNEHFIMTVWSLFVEVQSLAIKLTNKYPESAVAKMSKTKN